MPSKVDVKKLNSPEDSPYYGKTTKELGWYEGDIFILIYPEQGDYIAGYSLGEIITLVEGDNSICPWFRKVSYPDKRAFYTYQVIPIQEVLKQSDKINMLYIKKPKPKFCVNCKFHTVEEGTTRWTDKYLCSHQNVSNYSLVTGKQDMIECSEAREMVGGCMNAAIFFEQK